MITGLTQWILGIPGAPEFCASALPLVGGLGLLIALSVCDLGVPSEHEPTVTLGHEENSTSKTDSLRGGVKACFQQCSCQGMVQNRFAIH